MDKETLVRMYLEDHKTLDQIGKEVGITRQGVYYYVKKYDLPVEQAENVDFKCDLCGEWSSHTRKRFSRSIKHFCSGECYKAYLRNDGYRASRTGQRLGRLVIEKSLERRLMDGEVVHHIDGNNFNNDISNLMLFPSASEHIKHHHLIRRG